MAAPSAMGGPNAMADRNAGVAEEQRFEVRIGINLGDIIVDGDDIYGDGVNVAARLQEMSEPGRTCVSGVVFESVKDKLDLGFRDLGPQRVKNIAEPIHAFQVRDDPTGATAAAPTKDSQPHRP